MIKVPTDDDYKNFKGGSSKQLWRDVGNVWCCPSCTLAKRQLMRWLGTRWTAGMVRHHCHGPERYGAPYGIPASLVRNEARRLWLISKSRFNEVIICALCNSADGNAKAKLKLPTWFSFSPREINQFVTGRPHDKLLIDFNKAQEIYDHAEKA